MSEGARLEAQGLLERALTAYVGHREWDGAVRVAMSLNRQLEAARYLLEARRPYDAAVCFQRAGAPRECLDALLQVPPGTARYASACVHAVRVAELLSVPLDQLSRFFMPFISQAPASPAEASAMKAIAEAFEAADKARLASSIYRSVLRAYPGDAEAAESLAALEHAEPQPAVRTSPTPVPAASSPSGLHRPRFRLPELLVAKGLVPQTQLDRLLREQPEVGRSEAVFSEAVVAATLVTEEDLLKTLAESSGIAWLSDEELLDNLTAEAAKVLPLEHAERWKVAPIRVVDRQLHVAMSDPRDVNLVDKLRFVAGMKVVGFFATAAGIRRATAVLFHGEDPAQTEATSWHGKLLDLRDGTQGLQPFSIATPARASTSSRPASSSCSARCRPRRQRARPPRC